MPPLNTSSTEVDLSALLRWVSNVQCQPFDTPTDPNEELDSDPEQAQQAVERVKAQKEAQEFLQGLLGQGDDPDAFNSVESFAEEGGRWRVRAAEALLRAGALAFAEDEAQQVSPQWTAVHFAAELGDLELVRTLIRGGGLWNAVDAQGQTPGDVAFSMNHASVYRFLLDEGVRQTILLHALQRKGEEIVYEDEDEDEVKEGDESEENTRSAEAGQEPTPLQKQVQGQEQEVGISDQTSVSDERGDPREPLSGPSAERTTTSTGEEHITLLPGGQEEVTNNNQDFLQSKLRFLFNSQTGEAERCLDQDGNMVMSAWETDIMRASAAALALPHNPHDPEDEGWTVLNVGFGLGIVDRLLQAHSPKRHVIVEPHPDALGLMQQTGWVATRSPDSSGFSAASGDDKMQGFVPAAGPVPGCWAGASRGVAIVPSTWQEAVADPEGPLSNTAFAKAWAHLDDDSDQGQGKEKEAEAPTRKEEVLGPLDAIYFDTYSEDYGALLEFFDRLPSLLASGPQARFGFFHGLAATNAFLYDVMTAVVELDLRERGFKVYWHHMSPGVRDEDWEGVRREYWSLDEYRLPVAMWDEEL